MDVGIITGIAVTVINIVGWGYTKVYGFGKLNGRVDNLEKTTERHEKMLEDNGLIQKLGECKEQIAHLEGTLNTYIDLAKRENRDAK
jgi:hypothetical protein